MKICRICREAKPRTEFHRRASTKDGLRTECKACHIADVGEYNKRHAEHRRKYIREWTANKRLDPEARRNMAKANARWRVKHPDKVRQNTKAYYHANKDRNYIWKLDWSRANRDRIAAYSQRRRAARANGTLRTISRKEWQEILEYWNHQCAYCGQQFDSLTQDHVIALSRGGDHHPDNLVPACRSCNSRKKDKSLLEYCMSL